MGEATLTVTEIYNIRRQVLSMQRDAERPRTPPPANIEDAPAAFTTSADGPSRARDSYSNYFIARLIVFR